MMCDSKNGCKPYNCTIPFESQEDLMKYKEWLEHELQVVKKTLQDIKVNGI